MELNFAVGRQKVKKREKQGGQHRFLQQWTIEAIVTRICTTNSISTKKPKNQHFYCSHSGNKGRVRIPHQKD